jgi:hypothetical protein
MRVLQALVALLRSCLDDGATEAAALAATRSRALRTGAMRDPVGAEVAWGAAAAGHVEVREGREREREGGRERERERLLLAAHGRDEGPRGRGGGVGRGGGGPRGGA